VFEHENEAEGIESLGQWFKSTREEQGKTVDDVARITRIGKAYIIAIEEDTFNKLLPQQAYARGFIRQYAAFLGLPEDEVLKRMGTRYRVEENNHEAIDEHKSINFTKSLGNRPNFKIATKWLIPLFILLLIILIAALSGGKKSVAPPPAPAPTPVPVMPAFKPISSSQKPVQAPVQTPVSTTVKKVEETPDKDSKGSSASTIFDSTGNDTTGKDKSAVLKLKALQDSTIQVGVDDAEPQEYNLKTGETVTWKGSEGFDLELDNAAAVEGEENGVALKPFGSQGEAVHVLVKDGNVTNE